MQKRWLMSLFALLSVVFILSGCGADNGNTNGNANVNNAGNNNEPNNAEVNDAVVEVEFVISKNNGEEVIDTKTIEIEEGAFVLDVLKENFDVEEEGGFVTAIDGIKQDVDAQIGWMYFVNDEMAMVGAAEYELKADDKVNFDLQSWE